VKLNDQPGRIKAQEENSEHACADHDIDRCTSTTGGGVDTRKGVDRRHIQERPGAQQHDDRQPGALIGQQPVREQESDGSDQSEQSDVANRARPSRPFMRRKGTEAECRRDFVQQDGDRDQCRCRAFATGTGRPDGKTVGDGMDAEPNWQCNSRLRVMHVSVPVAVGMIVMFFVNAVAQSETLEQEHHDESEKKDGAQGCVRELSPRLFSDVQPLGYDDQQGAAEKETSTECCEPTHAFVIKRCRERYRGQAAQHRKAEDDDGKTSGRHDG
jgi:hypothetical protein